MPQYAFIPFVLTNHAKERMKLRRITASMIAHTLADPHKIHDSDDSTKYIRFTNRREVHVVAFYNPNQKKWIIKSTWVRGENDSAILKLLYGVTDWLQRLFKS